MLYVQMLGQDLAEVHTGKLGFYFKIILHHHLTDFKTDWLTYSKFIRRSVY